MINIFTIVLPHILMGIALWRLVQSDALDHDELVQPPAGPPKVKRPAPPTQSSPPRPPQQVRRDA